LPFTTEAPAAGAPGAAAAGAWAAAGASDFLASRDGKRDENDENETHVENLQENWALEWGRRITNEGPK
jgi:hypothetical protein